MSDMTISPDTKTDAEYMAEFEEIMGSCPIFVAAGFRVLKTPGKTRASYGRGVFPLEISRPEPNL